MNAVEEQHWRAIWALADELHARGASTANEVIRGELHCGKPIVSAAMKAWRQQQRVAVPPVDRTPPPVAPPPPEPPVTHLVRLRQQVAQLEAEVRQLEQTLQQRQQQLAQGRANYRNDVLAARRLVQDCRQAQQLAGNPTFFMDASMVEKAARLRQAFVDLVGEQDVAASLADMHYRPWWMHD
jgi:hypothetical protein